MNLNEIEDEFSISKQCFASEDFREGIRAFLEKKTPQFKRR
jgi:enoyl-CoA hydratase/carnithine racemase